MSLDDTGQPSNTSPRYTVTIIQQDDPNADQRWRTALDLLIDAGRVVNADKKENAA